MRLNLLCTKCGHEWIYKGNSNYRASCARCKKNVMIGGKRKYSYILDLEKYGAVIDTLIAEGNKVAIIDCLGRNVVDISTV